MIPSRVRNHKRMVVKLEENKAPLLIIHIDRALRYLRLPHFHFIFDSNYKVVRVHEFYVL